MKKIISAVSIITLFAACNSNPKNSLDTSKQIVVDTSRIYNNNLYSDTAKSVQAVAPGGASQSVRQVTVEDKNGVKTQTTTTTTTGPVATGTTHHVAHHKAASHSSGVYHNSGAGTTVSNNGTGTTSGDGTGTNTTYHKKGWSKAAQGAVIGGVGGAVAGAIIDKKHGQGAVIGGVVGAAGGYIIGRGKDKKDGRIQ